MNRKHAARPQENTQPIQFETLEPRLLLSGNPIGISPDFPTIDYNAGGVIQYDASSQTLATQGARPTIFAESPTGPFGFFLDDVANNALRSFQINIQVDNAGNLIGGTAGDDLIITGGLDTSGDFVPDVSGVLLTGEIEQLGWEELGGTDRFEFVFNVTGGLLASRYDGFDFGVVNFAEPIQGRPSFSGDFGVDFTTVAKGKGGAVTDGGGGEEPAELGDYVWEDLDGDGEQDGNEPGVQGVTVTLTGGGLDGVIGTEDDTTDSQLTGPDGEYLFTLLNPGEEYKVTFSNLPSGYEFTSQDTGSTDANDSDADLLSGMTSIVILAPGESNRTIDAGILAPAGLGDYVWRDSDVDGIQDNDEQGIENVLVELLDNQGNVINSTATDSTGFYQFLDLAPGTYSTRVAASNFDSGNSLDGLIPTLRNQGSDDAIDSDGQRTSPYESDQTTLQSGDYDPTLDFGYFTTGIDLEKTGADTAMPGEVIEYVFNVTNTGDVTLQDVVINDPLLSDSPIVIGTLLPGQTLSTMVNYTVPLSGATSVFDFEVDGVGQALVAGTIIDDEYAAQGLTVTTSNPLAHPIMVFDSANPTGGDNDLATPGYGLNNTAALGKILIVSEDANSADPDDNAAGGDIVFEFATPRTVSSVGILDSDADEPGSVIQAFDAMGNLLSQTSILNLGDNAFQQVAVNTDGVSKLRVYFVSSGAVSELVLAAPSTKITNVATVSGDPVDPELDLPEVTDSDDHVTMVMTPTNPSLDIEKFTNGVDADTADLAVAIAAGQSITWTYEVTNTGDRAYAASEVSVIDDNGTPANAADDFAPIFDALSDIGNDGILSPGETWTYSKSGIAADLGTGSGQSLQFNFDGSSSLDGTNGNIRTFTAGSVSVNASAFSRDSSGDWDAVFLGSYSGGLGVTDHSEGDGSNGTHRVDNVGEKNYVLFEFSQSVIVDQAFLDSVVNDSDISVWIGTVDNAFNSHVELSDSLLSSLDHYEVNDTSSSSARWANFNGGNVAGNVLVIAASVADATPEDNFKIRKLDVQTLAAGVFGNLALVSAPGASDADASYYKNPPIVPTNPSLDIEKLTNGVDADTADQAVEIAAGDTVTWTYRVTNTGDVAFSQNQVSVVDDNGTPDFAADDFMPTFDLLSDAGNDGILSPGEIWTYSRSTTAQALVSQSGQTTVLDFTGSSSTDGTNANIRTFSNDGLTVKTSAFSRDSSGDWDAVFLGAYSSGLGVTDNTEGSGGDGTHRVDNVGEKNYVLFEFSETVIVDQAFLDSVVNDSDISIWIGTINGAFDNHVTLSDALLNSLTHYEVNDTSSSSSRWANFNSGNVAGNVLIIAASVEDATPEDRFKIDALKVQRLAQGVYGNVATVTAPGAMDADASHYTNPENLGGGGGSDTGTVFDGDDYIVVEHEKAFLQNYASIALTFNAQNVQDTQGLISKDARGYGDGGHMSMMIQDGKLKVRLQSDDKSYWVTTNIQANTDYDVVFTYGKNGMNLYVNGQKVASNSYTGGMGESRFSDGNTENFVIGADASSCRSGSTSGCKNFFEGTMSDVRFIDQELAANQIAGLFGTEAQRTSSSYTYLFRIL